jgi:predicted RNA-binding protein
LSTSKENWQVCKTHLVWGMDYRYYVTLKKFVRKGDKAAVYTHGGEFVAVIEISGELEESFQHIGWTKKGKPYMFPYRVPLKILKEGKTSISYSTTNDPKNLEKVVWNRPNFIDELVFIADKGKTWNQYLQVSIVRITEEDFDCIESNL